MKPGRNDRKALLLTQDEEFDELHGLAGEMSEMFGLDRRIENHQRNTPLGLYAWDIEGLIIVVRDEIEARGTCADPSASGCDALKSLLVRLEAAYEEVTGAPY